MRGGRRARRSRGRQALRRPLILFTCAFALASGTAAFAYTTVSAGGSGDAQAVQLHAPGAATIAATTATSLSLSWAPSPGLPTDGGYLVLRSSTAAGPYEKASEGSCQQNATIVSSATSCTDTGLLPNTTYYYEIVADYYTVKTLWTSAPDMSVSGTTTQTASGPAPSAPVPNPPATKAPTPPAITSASSSVFLVGKPASFQVAATGDPTPTFSDTAFAGCVPNALPDDITFSKQGVFSGSPVSADVGSYTVCLDAANDVGSAATQRFTLTVANETLVFSSPAVSGAASTVPNLGPITVLRQTLAGAPITTGALTVNLGGSPSGATFGTTQFATTQLSNITIPDGQSTASFWYGETSPGSPSLTASAVGAVSGTQTETITAAPAGLGVALDAGGSGSPVLVCQAPGLSGQCNITGVGPAGHAVVTVGFRSSSDMPVTYSATESSSLSGSGSDASTATVDAGASSSGLISLPVGTTSFTFGPYALVINVGASPPASA